MSCYCVTSTHISGCINHNKVSVARERAAALQHSCTPTTNKHTHTNKWVDRFMLHIQQTPLLVTPVPLPFPRFFFFFFLCIFTAAEWPMKNRIQRWWVESAWSEGWVAYDYSSTLVMNSNNPTVRLLWSSVINVLLRKDTIWSSPLQPHSHP